MTGGDALQELERTAPDARVINLETSVTRSDDFWPGKEVHYRMSPDNVPCLSALHPDVCVLANNHVLDFGRPGLLETLETLHKAGLRTAGAGRDLDEARRPAVLLTSGHPVSVLAWGTDSSGVAPDWAATAGQPGVDFLPDFSDVTVAEVCERVRREKDRGHLVVASIHWGSNWGFDVPRDHIRFAHRLVECGVDVLHGHSSHHVRPMEVYSGRLILYGCGDFLNDYEGIRGEEEYRGDLTLMYLATLQAETGELRALRMVPLRIRRVRLERAEPEDARWLETTLNRVSGVFGTVVRRCGDGSLSVG
jgi:poly-gamma-glutamate synthesis protein (capsule biosynthesis protein)